MFYKSDKLYMNQPHCKNLQKIDRNKTGTFGVCTVSATEVETSG